ncbi:MAG TPA: LTA synthase family protein, partial [Tissierellaceae bacterium]
IKERSHLEKGELSGIAKGKNLVVIQVESLQNFVMGLEYNNQEITPNLNKLVEDSSTIYFDKFYQMIGKGNTSDAEFSTNNSLYPSMTGPSYGDYEQNNFNGLPWLLRDEGYTAWAFHGYKKDFWNRNNAYKAQGFQKFISEDDFNVKKEDIIGFGLNDEKFLNMSVDYIKELDSIDDNPFYAFLITLTSHNPYKMPDSEEYLKIEDKYKDTILGDYFQSIYYTDKQIGNFIDRLKEEGLYDNTVFAIYGDHFGISAAHEDYKVIMDDFLEEEYTLEEMQNIPLLIHIPNEDINQTVSKVSSHLDFLPTIANLMDLDLSDSLIFGRDILNYKDTNYVATQTYMIKGSFISDNEVFIMSRDGVFSNSTVYDINTKSKLNTDDYREIYEKLTSEINMCDYILKNNLYNEILSGKYDFNIKNDILLDEYIYKDDGNLDYIKDVDNKKSFVIDVWYNEETSEFIFGNDTDIYTFTDLIQSNENPNTVLRFDNLDFERVRRLFTNILRYTRENDKDALTGLYPIARTFDEYHYLKTLGHEPIADILAMNLSPEQLEDFINNLDLKIALVNDYK